MTGAPAVHLGQEAAFSRAVFDGRVTAARAALAARGIDVMVVTGPENIFYLTGQQTPGYYTFQALVLPVSGEPRFIVRQLESMNCRANTYLDDLVAYGDGDDPLALLSDITRKAAGPTGKVGIDKRGWFLPIGVYETLQGTLGDMVDAAGVIESLRAVKSPEEVAKIAQAARYVDAGIAAGYDAITAGATENDMVAAMLEAAVRAGSEYLGMEPLASSGPRSGVPHGTWKRRRFEAGDPVFLEMAACHDRYHAVLMRSAWLGTPPDDALRMMDACQRALDAALGAMKPGNTCEQVHEAAQAVIDAAGYTDAYRKRTGYSVGISFAPDWGEWQVASLFTGIKTELKPGMVFHVPPALRLYGAYTVGVSETVVVTEDGYRALGTIPRDLRVI
ncbi:aminopeptidase P family protein [Roseospira marina]|uniref:Aminopeptidase P family protein n=1 Tax=Roseospira marina TaxID=140057 RepID=A0A5M6IEA4_9PROT|nr:Xaa-Pro peptidase family protein [Roseospira marina]KAA5606600.1 aminopeptidase P family protein [Roseospira marina]MBB4313998.1 Xaa-Pro dipeptidase [Roseospira marina]MBB5087160.1 Xaa-Pro dipeptidase [Roseospira marina]